eukprot:2556367-Prymnesium_polylepis.1
MAMSKRLSHESAEWRQGAVRRLALSRKTSRARGWGAKQCSTASGHPGLHHRVQKTSTLFPRPASA